MKSWDNDNKMTSRKRNKGKERKAKKAELEVERIENERARAHGIWTGWAQGEKLMFSPSIECNHGVALVIPDDKNHPVINFIDAFFHSWATNKNNFQGVLYLHDTFQNHSEVWGNESYREMAVNIFIAIGTNFMLNNDGPQDTAKAIVALENYDGSSGNFHSVICNRVASKKMRDINGGESSAMRDMLKFFRKRTSCKCLKAMHLEARKTLPKLGMCDHCRDSRERTLLLVCSRCRIAQYCSRKCQVADWSRHKVYCGGCIVLVEQQGATNN